tara:strand:+ start:209 stop:481 length:273 start_codon:yes stop_codon:yes gene_type:complete
MKKTNEDVGGPWKVSKCRVEELEEVLNDLVATGYLIHTLYSGDEGGHQTFTIAAIEERFVQPAQVLTEEQQASMVEEAKKESLREEVSQR